MALNLNKVTLIGNLGRDAESKTFEGGGTITNLNVATSDNYKNKDGEWVDVTDWHNVTIKGKGAERAAQLKKGANVLVEGKLKTRSYSDKDGNTKYITEVVCWMCQENKNGGGGKVEQADVIPPHSEDDLAF